MNNFLLLAPVIVGSVISFREETFNYVSFLISIALTLVIIFLIEKLAKKSAQHRIKANYITSFLLFIFVPLTYFIQNLRLSLSISFASLIFLFFAICRIMIIKAAANQDNAHFRERYILVFGYSLMIPFLLVLAGQFLKIFPSLTAIVMFSYFLDSRILRDIRLSKSLENTNLICRTDKFIFVFGVLFAVGWFQMN